MSKVDYLRQMLAMEREKRSRDQRTIARQGKTIAMLSDHVERVMGAMRSYVEMKLAADAKAKQLRSATQRLRTVIDKQQLSIRVHQQLIASLRDTGSTLEGQLFDMDRRYKDVKGALQQLRKHHAESLATAQTQLLPQSQLLSQSQPLLQTQLQSPQLQQQQERRMKRVDSLRSATNRHATVPTVSAVHTVTAATTATTVSTGGVLASDGEGEGEGEGEGSQQYISEDFDEASAQGQAQAQGQTQGQGQGQAQENGQGQGQGQGQVGVQIPQIHGKGQGQIQMQRKGEGQVQVAEGSTVSEELYLNSPDAKVGARVIVMDLNRL